MTSVSISNLETNNSSLKAGSNYQDLFKFIAIVAMIIDHYGMFFENNSWLRLVGRISMPIFTFFAGYNYFLAKKKHNNRICFQLKRYQNLLALGLSLQVMAFLYLPFFNIYNILISIIIGLLIIDLIEYIKIPTLLVHLMLISIVIPTYKLFDYGAISIAFVFIGYYAHHKDNKSYILYLIIWLSIFALSAYVTMNFQGMQNIILVIICMYQFWILSSTNFNHVIPGKIFLISRYILPIYFWHFTIFAIISSYSLS